MDQNSLPTYIEASAEASVLAARSFVETMHDTFRHPRIVEPVVTPRFVPTCSDDLLVGLGALAASHNVQIQSHLAESHDQVNAVLTERGVDDINVFERVSSKLLSCDTFKHLS